MFFLFHPQAQVRAGPVNAPENVTETAAPAPVKEMNDADTIDENDDAEPTDETSDADMEADFENQSPGYKHETTTSNTSHLFNSNADGSSSVTPNLDAFMRAFEAIDQNVYNEIETFLENIVPKLPENNNPITNHLESAVFLFELYEKMKEPRDLNNSQEQHFLSEIENFLASNSFLLFNKPTGGRQDLEDDLAAEQDGDDQNQEFELNDDLQDNNLEELKNDEDTTDKQEENNMDKEKDVLQEDKPQENIAAAA